MFIVGSATRRPTPEELNVEISRRGGIEQRRCSRLTIEVRESVNPRVTSVRALDDYQLEVSFENGECRRFAVKPCWTSSVQNASALEKDEYNMDHSRSYGRVGSFRWSYEFHHR
jgi:hypothetical protein